VAALVLLLPGRTAEDDRFVDVDPSGYVTVVSVTVSTVPSSWWTIRVEDDMDSGCCCCC
jgi:hypothetical protein